MGRATISERLWWSAPPPRRSDRDVSHGRAGGRSRESEKIESLCGIGEKKRPRKYTERRCDYCDGCEIVPNVPYLPPTPAISSATTFYRILANQFATCEYNLCLLLRRVRKLVFSTESDITNLEGGVLSYPCSLLNFQCIVCIWK